ncbi:heavy metal-associated isoprenylated plant protein 9 isoform X2 [Punica granatum]|uniref:Heavy metal-associated isoprenylated plant protein 9 isoform X2 n=1 Tax=Punica granatum TaxID=22663 RepID=A0A6P8DKC6_PUNGR|nr:heavy metal-associated isoprenylated plant protein 9 isoform X2 [Punica granatum]
MGEEAKQAKAEEKPVEKVEENKKEEETNKEEKKEEEKKEEEPKPPSPCVLYVDLHCVGCAKKIERSILKIQGVEGVVIDMAQNQVTLKGIVDPQAVCNRIIKKTKRRAKVLSPLPPAEGEPLPQVLPSQVSGPTTVELNVNMHCEACAEQLKRKILKMRGVQTAVTDLGSSKVTVTGTMDAEKLVDYVYRRTKKQARIIPQPEPEKPPESKPEEKPAEEASSPPIKEKKGEDGEKKEEGGEKKEEQPQEGEAKKEDEKEGKEEEPKKVELGDQYHLGDPLMTIEEESLKRMMYSYQPMYVIERIPPAPQLFSDENPNACSVS